MNERTCDVPGCGRSHRARGLCSTHYNQRVLTKGRRHPQAMMVCVVCGSLALRYLGKTYRPTCSTACRSMLTTGGDAASKYDWTTDAMMRARRFGAQDVEPIQRRDVFERDGYLCQLCHQLVDAGADPTSSRAPSIDHITPLSMGGQHTMDNVRTTHYGCNSSRGRRAA